MGLRSLAQISRSHAILRGRKTAVEGASSYLMDGSGKIIFRIPCFGGLAALCAAPDGKYVQVRFKAK